MTTIRREPRPPPPSTGGTGARPPVPLAQLPTTHRVYARSIDEGYGNKDGMLETSELDAFARLYGNRSEHQDPIALLRNILDPGAATGAGAVTAESLALAQRLVRPGGSGDARDVDAVVAEAARLPAAILRKAEAAGIKFVACRGSVTDHLRQLRGQAPRGWPAGVTWDTVPGLYWPGTRDVVVATMDGPAGSRQVPGRGFGHGSSSLVAHELLHGLDYRRALGDVRATDRAYLDAWRADRAQLPDYLAQNPPAGPEEAFAELAARALLGDTQLAQAAPNLTRYFEAAKRTWGVSP